MQTNHVITQSVFAIIMLFLHFNIPLKTEVFLFSYFFPRFGQMSKNVLQPLNFIQGHVCITVVKTSNVFYLHLLWHKSLFQVVTKCANNYQFFKNMFPLQTLTNKTPVCKSNLCQHSLDETTLDTLHYNE